MNNIYTETTGHYDFQKRKYTRQNITTMLRLKPSTKRHYFELECSIQELTNIPQLQGKCYMVVSLSDSQLKESSSSRKISFREKSDKIAIKDHKCVWNYKISGLQFKLYEDGKNGLLTDKWLTVSFISENENKDKNVLGKLSINLTEYVNETKPVTNRFLLQDSKVNSICKLTLFLNSEAGSRPSGGFKVSSGNSNTKSTPISTTATSTLSSSIPSRSSSVNRHARTSSSDSGFDFNKSKSGAPLPSSIQTTSNLSTSPPSHSNSGSNLHPILSNNSANSSNSGLRTPTQGPAIWNMTNSVASPVQAPVSGSNGLLNDFTIDSLSNNPTLNQFINKTFQFTWQEDKGLSYTEFTPAECVQDIIKNNGIGWKRDDEGIPYIDRLNTEEKPKKTKVLKRGGHLGNNEKPYHNLFTHSRSGASDEFEEDDEQEDEDDDGDDDDEDDRDSFLNDDEATVSSTSAEKSLNDDSKEFKGLQSNKKNKSKCRLWISPYSELDVREDLRSWHVSNIDDTKYPFSKSIYNKAEA